jgi:hypothetical protein
VFKEYLENEIKYKINKNLLKNYIDFQFKDYYKLEEEEEEVVFGEFLNEEGF